MRTDTTFRPLLLALCLVPSVACGGGGGSSPTAPPMPDPGPAPSSSSASFRVVEDGQSAGVSYEGGSNLIFCRTAAGWADLWIRLAESPAADGGSGPHIDIDVCGLGGGGTFGPKDPSSTDCAGKTFDVWWHGSGSVFVNAPTAPTCSLTLSRAGDVLTGTFRCDSMPEQAGGPRRVHLRDGTFECTVE